MAVIYYMLSEVNNTYYLFIMVPVSWWDILRKKRYFVLQVDVLEAGKMSKHRDLREFETVLIR